VARWNTVGTMIWSNFAMLTRGTLLAMQYNLGLSWLPFFYVRKKYCSEQKVWTGFNVDDSHSKEWKLARLPSSLKHTLKARRTHWKQFPPTNTLWFRNFLFTSRQLSRYISIPHKFREEKGGKNFWDSLSLKKRTQGNHTCLFSGKFQFTVKCTGIILDGFPQADSFKWLFFCLYFFLIEEK